MQNTDRYCVIQLQSTAGDGEILPFDVPLWEKVKRCAEVRLRKWKDSKYKSICEKLPNMCNDSHGFHRICYKNFTAVPQSNENNFNNSKEVTERLLRSDVQHPSTSTSGLFQSACLFCNKRRKKVRGMEEQLGICESSEAQESITNAATVLIDTKLFTKIAGIDFSAKEVRYHHSCRRKYLHASESIVKEINKDVIGESEHTILRNAHNRVFDDMVLYIKEKVIKLEEPVLLTSIHSWYTNMLSENGISESNYPARNLEEKLLRHFGGSLKSGNISKKQGNVLYPTTIEEKEAIESSFHAAKSSIAAVTEAAFTLRQLILELKLETEGLPFPLSASDLAKGEAAIPDVLLLFYRILYTGSMSKKENSESAERHITSAAQDAIFAVSKGSIMPSKHLCLGLGLKSLTGSKKVINILNRYGHCISYSKVEELETDLAFSAVQNNKVTPDGFECVPGLSTGTAWDNYDEMNETLSGSNTIHDTVGICYQNISHLILPVRSKIVTTGSVRGRRQRQRCFDIGTETSLEPYHKKPKISNIKIHINMCSSPMHLLTAQNRDRIWMMDCSFHSDTPMWVGWNCKVIIDDLPGQIIGYMDNITAPPTRNDVVLETPRLSQQVASECQEEYAVVTYDLAVAKIAMQIQCEEKPKFDNVFICFGQFHIQLAYFRSLGYLIDESGGPHILTDTGVLASGSLNGFLSGKHFNRCKRLHPMFALAMKTLHFRSFLETAGDITEIIMKFSDFHKQVNLETLRILEQCDDVLKFIYKYEQYTEDTRKGNHGKSAQFWLLYCDKVDLFLLCSRACRTNDIELFTYCLEQMCPIFFATNKHNYAKWMTLYHSNLLNMDETHPGVRKILAEGAFTIKRMDKSFTRNPVDLTLEQTINADAASKLTGITCFSQSISARKRWMITRAARSSVVSALMLQVGLTYKESASEELKPYRIKRDNNDYQKLMEGIQSTMNPFTKSNQFPNLYCISSGKMMPDVVSKQLSDFDSIGKKWYLEFRNLCIKDPANFEKPIKRQRVLNCASASKTTKLEVKDRKMAELRVNRDLFGRLLILATTMDIDLKKIFAYPLTEIPLCIGQCDGSMNKTSKATLFHFLENKTISTTPSSIDAVVFDLMYIIQSLKDLPSTYGGVAQSVLKIICQRGARIDVVADTYNVTTVKDAERYARGGTVKGLQITGPDQRRPVDFQSALHSADFKTSFIRFLADEWKKDCYVAILGKKTLYFGLDKICYLYKVEDGNMVTTLQPILFCEHDEADTRIVFHVSHMCEEKENFNIIVRGSDTDILIILLANIHKFSSKIWMDVGVASNNSRHYIDVTGMAITIGLEYCLSLPGYHAFTGCDYTASFLRKGKTKPLQILEKNKDFVAAFSSLGNSAHVSEETINTIEHFVCTMYGKPKYAKVNDARLALFKSKYSPSNARNPLDKVKGTDSSLLPPCLTALIPKIKRANFVAQVWKAADTRTPAQLDPTDHGWKITDGKYSLVWFIGDQIPKDVRLQIDENFLDHMSDEESDFAAPEESDSDSDN